jgi:hypothetical protein
MMCLTHGTRDGQITLRTVSQPLWLSKILGFDELI